MALMGASQGMGRLGDGSLSNEKIDQKMNEQKKERLIKEIIKTSK
jgi:hypothetical protein